MSVKSHHEHTPYKDGGKNGQARLVRLRIMLVVFCVIEFHCLSKFTIIWPYSLEGVHSWKKGFVVPLNSGTPCCAVTNIYDKCIVIGQTLLPLGFKLFCLLLSGRRCPEDQPRYSRL